MYEKIKKLICKQLSKSADKVNPESKLVQDLGADSLDIVEMLMELEDEYGISIPDEVAQNLVTVKDVADYIDSKVKK